MSVLTLTTLRCPDIVPVDRRRVTGGEFVIGRGEDCDWRLPDPDKKLSKHHCVLEYSLGGWQVRDVSTNGTFLNDGPERIARDTSRPIVDGDRLRLGPYEIEARIAADRTDPQPYRSDPFAPDLPLPAEGSPAVAQRVPADLLPPLAGVDPLFPRAPAGPLGPFDSRMTSIRPRISTPPRTGRHPARSSSHRRRSSIPWRRTLSTMSS